MRSKMNLKELLKEIAVKLIYTWQLVNVEMNILNPCGENGQLVGASQIIKIFVIIPLIFLFINIFFR